jgi:hypothetical protein
MSGSALGARLLSAILNIPKTPLEWTRWSFHHRLQHDQIQQAIMEQKGVSTTTFVLDPINFGRPRDFLERNQETHTQMNAPLGLQGSDLEDVDLKDPRQLQAWIFAEYQELFSASAALKI